MIPGLLTLALLASPPSPSVELWASAQAVDVGQDLTIVRSLDEPTGTVLKAPDLDPWLASWGLTPEPMVSRPTEDGLRRIQRWTGTTTHPGVIQLPGDPVPFVDGSGATGTVAGQELLIRVGPDPQGPLPPPAPAELGELPIPKLPHPPPRLPRWWPLPLALLLSLAAGALALRGRRSDAPKPDPLHLLRQQLTQCSQPSLARELLAGFLVEQGDLAPGDRSPQALANTARSLGWEGDALAQWFQDSQAAVYRGSDPAQDGQLMTAIREIVGRPS